MLLELELLFVLLLVVVLLQLEVLLLVMLLHLMDLCLLVEEHLLILAFQWRLLRLVGLQVALQRRWGLWLVHERLHMELRGSWLQDRG